MKKRLMKKTRELKMRINHFISGKIEPVLRPTTLTKDLAGYEGDFAGLYNMY